MSKKYEYKGGKGRNIWLPIAPKTITHARVHQDVKHIEPLAFTFCKNLRSIQIPEGVEIVGEGAFQYCTSLEAIEFPSSLKRIDKGAFKRCSALKTIQFQEGLEIVEKSAFQNCTSLETIEFPSSLERIEGNSDGNSDFLEGAFLNCNALKSICFEEGIEYIGPCTFSGCTKVTSIEFPSSLGEIGEYAFNYCSGLKSISFKEGLHTIDTGAFSGCEGLERVDFPQSLSQLEVYSFQSCHGLKSIHFPQNGHLREIEREAFAYCTRLETIEFPSRLNTIENRAFRGCSMMKTVTFPPLLNCIAEKAFYECSALKSLCFNNGLESIRERSFAHCTNLESIEFGEGLTEIREASFSTCKSLKTIKFPLSLVEVQARAFEGCSMLTSMNFGEGSRITKVGNNAFAGCKQVTSLTIPASFVDMPTAFIELLDSVLHVKFEDMLEAKKEPFEGNTVLHQLIESKYSLPFVEAFLEACPSAIKATNHLGQTPLHFCLANECSLEIVEAIYNQWPGAVDEKNEIGQTPLDLWKKNGSNPQVGSIILSGSPGEATRPTIDAFLLRDGDASPYNTPCLLQGQHILLEVADSVAETTIYHDGKNKGLKTYFIDQLDARKSLFESLLNEFASLIHFQDKTAIQQAAAVQALCGEYISRFDDVYIDFSKFSSSAWWYQQEILKLVLRVYHEDWTFCKSMTSGIENYVPSVFDDAFECKIHMQHRAPRMTPYRIATFIGLTHWIVDDCDTKDFNLEGPVPKSLQSLFNKMYIRRGQTQISIIGDITRATLSFEKEEDLKRAISKLKKEFPNMSKFKSPAKTGLVEFLEQIAGFKTIDLLMTKIIPYRLKLNSSQKRRKTELLYNFNFFDLVPEYHRVGSTEMFVAFELQIGLASEIKSLRTDHKAYEERRILEAQPLLKKYIEATKKKQKNSTTVSSSQSHANETKTNCHSKVVTAILEGSFSTSNLGALKEKELKREGTIFRPPNRLCLNHKRLNKWANDGKAFIIDEVTSLDPSLHYCVKSLLLKTISWPFDIHFGLFARIGPYIISISSRFISEGTEHSIIQPQLNPETLERISPLPLGCEEVYLIAWGESLTFVPNSYMGMELVLEQYRDMDKDANPQQDHEVPTDAYESSMRDMDKDANPQQDHDVPTDAYDKHSIHERMHGALVLLVLAAAVYQSGTS